MIKKALASLVLVIFSFLNIHHSMGAFLMQNMQMDSKMESKQMSCCDNKKPNTQHCDTCCVDKISNTNNVSIQKNKDIKYQKQIKYIFDNKFFIKNIIKQYIKRINSPPNGDIDKNFSYKYILGISKKLE